jgi:hypothetical protein
MSTDLRSFRLAGAAFTVRYIPVGTEAGSVGDYMDDVAPGSKAGYHTQQTHTGWPE